MSVTIPLRTLVAFATGLAVALIAVFVFQAWRVDAAPGDSDTTFVPITPCRLVDTRPAPLRVGPHGAFGIDDTKTIAARGTNGGCTIPNDAIGLSLNVTAVGASQATFLTVWPDGTKPTASSLNPTPGQPPTPNAVTTQLSGAGAFNVFNRFGTVDVIIDINGYHTKASLQDISTRLIALESSNTAQATRIVELETTRPFAVTNRDDVQFLTNTAEVVVSVTVTAPIAGQVVVNSSTEAFTSIPNWGAECTITSGNIVSENDYAQRWESAGTFGELGQLGGTRMFDIAAGVTETYNLACRNFGVTTPSTGVENSVLTAIFTPAP